MDEEEVEKFRSDNNKIMVENYGETVQGRQIPNPVRTFGEAYADFRKSHSFLKVIPREPQVWHICDLYLYMYSVCHQLTSA